MIHPEPNPQRTYLPLWLTLLLMLFALIGGGGGGLLVGVMLNRSPAGCPEQPAVCEEFTVFWEAWSLARQRYVDAEAADPKAMTAGAINGMIDSLGDQGHTRFLTALEAGRWEAMLQREHFDGIGAFIDVRDGQALIVNPIEGSPAEEAGLRPGDLILAVDGESTSGWSAEQLQGRIRGPRGTTVTLRILHPNGDLPVEVTLTRAALQLPSVSWQMLPNQLALVRLFAFNQEAGRELREVLTRAQSQGARAVILDLRDNPGGLLDEAIEVASQFLPSGTTILIEESRSGLRQERPARSGGVALNTPLLLLINGNSASSSEIVAGALQAAGRATLVGETTVGTGTVLTPFVLSDGSRLLLGTQQWLTPDGRLIRGQGIEPDEQVTLPPEGRPLLPSEAARLTLEALRDSGDTQLVRAIELAAGQP